MGRSARSRRASTFDLPERQGLEVVGSEGTLRVATPWAVNEPGIEFRRGHDTQLFAIERVDRYRVQAENLSRAVRGLESPLLGREDALGQARAIDALYRSAERGGDTVSL